MPAKDRVALLASDAAVSLSYVRPMALDAHVVALARAMPLEQAREVAARLASNPDVEYAEPDRWLKPAFVPNDDFINAQTYLGNGAAAINAFGAWDITTGSPNVVVAVLDTGYRPHSAMAGRFVQGYDFVSDPAVANDGDGRDADASDPGDWVTQADKDGHFQGADCAIASSTWHGTAVAGVIGANGNDHTWTAGIDWSAKILPVRVLGKCGGSFSDIIDGIAWAAGLPVPGAARQRHAGAGDQPEPRGRHGKRLRRRGAIGDQCCLRARGYAGDCRRRGQRLCPMSPPTRPRIALESFQSAPLPRPGISPATAISGQP